MYIGMETKGKREQSSSQEAVQEKTKKSAESWRKRVLFLCTVETRQLQRSSGTATPPAAMSQAPEGVVDQAKKKRNMKKQKTRSPPFSFSLSAED